MLKKTIFLLLLTALAACIALASINITPNNFSVNVAPGASLRSVAKTVAKDSVAPAWLLVFTGRLTGAAAVLKAGQYTLPQAQTALSFWRALGAQTPEMVEIKLQEGWTFKQIRAAINASEGLKHDTATLSDAALMRQLGAGDQLPEGRFFPDTYLLGLGSTDAAVYKAAFERMKKISTKVWEMRPPTTPLKSIDDLINLAAIVEKETAKDTDRAKVASVFHNRLNIGMRLQTDPTVIYGMGDDYAGRIRKVDLQTDTPFNTYTRAGLPPTPIAAPSEASLRAAMNPDQTDFLYFVARGDGSGASRFSATLAQHNQAVADYLARR
jgi:UPF0755 protein